MLIKLTQEKYAVIDDKDFKLIDQYKWCIQKTKNLYYARTYTHGSHDSRKHMSMHRLIMNAQLNQQIDHINGDGLDNRRCNLRFATKSQNAANQKSRRGSSKFKGVCWHKRRSKWISQIVIKQKRLYLGYFNNETEAAKSYNIAAKKYFGEFAKLNVIKD